MFPLVEEPMRALVRRLNAITSLSSEEQQLILQLPAMLRHLRAGHDIASQGDKPDRCALVVSGWLCRYKVTGGGRKQILSFHIPGDIPDLQSLLLETMDHNLAAVTDVRIAYPWAFAWMERVLPAVEALCSAHADHTVFTRFIPASRPAEGPGTWARYYRRWADVTLDRIGPDGIRLVPALERLVPPAHTIDKRVYSPWTEGRLDGFLSNTEVDTLVVSGGETDVCVLATVLGAVDRGFRVVLAIDALCSSADATHDALMELYLSRFSEQIEAATTAEILHNWHV